MLFYLLLCDLSAHVPWYASTRFRSCRALYYCADAHALHSRENVHTPRTLRRFPTRLASQTPLDSDFQHRVLRTRSNC